LESNIKVFIRTAFVILSAFIALLLVFSVAYAFATINAYNVILIAFIIAICICILVSVIMCLAIVYTYKRKKASGIFLVLAKLGLKLMIPVALVLAKANTKTKKSIRYLYIELNNIVVESDNKKYRVEDIMLLLPHCLQNSDCGLKVTNNPDLCKRCGKCKIGALLDYTDQKSISLFIATGGTVARNIIKKNKPKLIISVACERDLMSGISDVRWIPVVGVTNKQPNGPCYNTDVDIHVIQERIDQLTF